MSLSSHKSLKTSEDVVYRIIKRLMDLVLSLVLLFFLLPVFFIVIFLVLLTDGRPVFFKQQRVGHEKRMFTMVKFRTMTNNNRTLHKKYEWSERVPDEFVFKSGSDEHVTEIGKWLRKFSLDELPQLYNVIRGDMSLVGPRPEVLAIAKHYDENQQKRLKVKPGITGFAQIHGRSDITHGQKMSLDVHYIENYSFKLDMLILIKTIGTVFTGRGAY